MRVEQAGNLRSMFLFSVAQDQLGLDLRLQVNNGPNPLLEAIQQQMTQDPEYAATVAETQGAIDLDDLNSMYRHPEFGRLLPGARGTPHLRSPTPTTSWSPRSGTASARTSSPAPRALTAPPGGTQLPQP